MSLLGDVLSDLGRDEAAIGAYEAVLKSIGTSARSAGVMRNLTISYENVARHEDAYRRAGEALSFDRAGLTTDLYFMCAAAEAHASLGKMKGARDTLTLLAAKKPEFREHPHFKAAVDVVEEKMRPILASDRLISNLEDCVLRIICSAASIASSISEVHGQLAPLHPYGLALAPVLPAPPSL